MLFFICLNRVILDGGKVSINFLMGKGHRIEKIIKGILGEMKDS